MAKKVIPRDKSRVEHAAKHARKAPAKAKAAAPRPANRKRRSGARSAPQKTGIAGFFQRLFTRFKRQ